jgi:hypothetical protein
VVSRRDSRFIIIFATLLFLSLLLIIQNGNAALQIFNFQSIPLYRKVVLSLSVFFSITDSFTPGATILAVLGSLLGGINISMAYTYMRLRGDVILKSGLYSGIGLIFAFLGIGCAACGTALLGVLLGFFGLSTMLNLLPYQGQEIGYIGVIFLCIATYTLGQKVNTPNVC